NVKDDPFYQTPSIFPHGIQGSVLRHEIVKGTQFAKYTSLNPSIAFHRILYESKNLKGDPVPASAFILLPQTPPSHTPLRTLVWTHGTTGIFRTCAPSNQQDLQYGWMGPLAMVTRGYAVIAPDYAGLGSDTSFEYESAPSHTDDVLGAVIAARKVLPLGTISREWIVAGHSEGGLTAWAVNERDVEQSIDGFLGSVVISPAFDPFYGITLNAIENDPYWGGMTYGIFLFITVTRQYDSIKPEDYFTETGLRLWTLIEKNEACAVTGLGVFQGLSFDDLFKDLSWLKSNEVADLRQRANILGHKRLSKPALVIEALGDIGTPPKSIEDVLEEHCAAYPYSQMQLSKYPGLDHWSILFASQAEYFQWIEDRFEGK
ncbi:hypothetical protein M422DRAFT_115769, partial [Sphaerobolus stellatus SS14]